jgi:hypothetical protein
MTVVTYRNIFHGQGTTQPNPGERGLTHCEGRGSGR